MKTKLIRWGTYNAFSRKWEEWYDLEGNDHPTAERITTEEWELPERCYVAKSIAGPKIVYRDDEDNPNRFDYSELYTIYGTMPYIVFTDGTHYLKKIK